MDRRFGNPALDEREDIWSSALRAAASVARQAAFSEADVLRAVTEELRRLQMRGGVSLLLPDGRLQIHTRSVSRTTERALERLAGMSINGYVFDPRTVDVYSDALTGGEPVFTADRATVVRQLTPRRSAISSPSSYACWAAPRSSWRRSCWVDSRSAPSTSPPAG